MKKFVIKKDDANIRLDVYLAGAMDETRSQTQKLIKRGLVLVNDRVKAPHYAVKGGDEIKIKEPKLEKAKPEKAKLNIVFKNKDLVVIDKQSGIIVHPPHKPFDKTTISDLLVKKFSEIKSVGENMRPGIVHRLDKDVSGLMVAARNKLAFEHLKNEFKQGNVKKIYTGLVFGKVKNQTGEISLKIGRSKSSKRMAARPEGQEGKEALTFYRVIKKFTNATLLEIELKTGRTHQIRAHFHAIGHPLFGDPLYKPKKSSKNISPRIFLHSTILGFHNLNNEWLEFNSPLPDDLNEYLNELKEV